MSARPLSELTASACRRFRALLTDIDGTMTDADGRVPATSFAAMEHARTSGLRVVVVTGRPAGWCDLIARTWPVDGVVGENGGLAMWRTAAGMRRVFVQDEAERVANRARLGAVREQVLAEVPGCAIAADQPYRELDLAVDFAEDVAPLDDAAVDRIVAIFEGHGAHAKVSNIHVNGWFGAFDKRSMCLRMAREWWDLDLQRDPDAATFLGDSPNDEPMFELLPRAIGVANVRRFLDRMDHPPGYVADTEMAQGFADALQYVAARR